jgi:hypothetical protein
MLWRRRVDPVTRLRRRPGAPRPRGSPRSRPGVVELRKWPLARR